MVDMDMERVVDPPMETFTTCPMVAVETVTLAVVAAEVVLSMLLVLTS